MSACSIVLLTNLVTRLDPFHCTTVLLTKLEPTAVNANPEPPAVAELGLMIQSDGGGGAVCAPATLKPAPNNKQRTPKCKAIFLLRIILNPPSNDRLAVHSTKALVLPADREGGHGRPTINMD
jgi:hypothetical protein